MRRGHVNWGQTHYLADIDGVWRTFHAALPRLQVMRWAEKMP
jgi:hypothetical protein